MGSKDDAVGVRLCRERAENGIRLEVEDENGAGPTAVADKAAAHFRNDRDAMGDFLTRDIGNDLAGLRINHLRVGAAGNKEAMRWGLDRQIVPGALAANRKCLDHMPVRWSARRQQTGGEEKSQQQSAEILNLHGMIEHDKSAETRIAAKERLEVSFRVEDIMPRTAEFTANFQIQMIGSSQGA